MSKELWRPSSAAVERSQLTVFQNQHGFDSYDELHRWSVQNPEESWAAYWEFADLIPARLPSPTVTNLE